METIRRLTENCDPNSVLGVGIGISGIYGLLFGELLLPTITRTISDRARYFREVEVIISPLGRLASCVGASAFVLGES